MKGSFEVAKTKATRSLGRTVLSSPLLVAVGAAVLVVFVLSFAGYARRGGFWSPEVEARVFTSGRATKAVLRVRMDSEYLRFKARFIQTLRDCGRPLPWV